MIKFRFFLVLTLIFIQNYSVFAKTQLTRHRSGVASLVLSDKMEIGELQMQFDLKACVASSLIMITVLYLLYHLMKALNELQQKIVKLVHKRVNNG